MPALVGDWPFHQFICLEVFIIFVCGSVRNMVPAGQAAGSNGRTVPAGKVR